MMERTTPQTPSSASAVPIGSPELLLVDRDCFILKNVADYTGPWNDVEEAEGSFALAEFHPPRTRPTPWPLTSIVIRGDYARDWTECQAWKGGYHSCANC